MIITKLNGGIGNQMFQYAAAYSISKFRHQRILLSVSNIKNDSQRDFKLDQFQIEHSALIDNSSMNLFVRIMGIRIVNKVFRLLQIRNIRFFEWLYILESNFNYPKYMLFTLETNNVCIDGYWQDYKIFDAHSEKIKDQLKLKNIPDYIKKIAGTLGGNSCVSIHIRRGDYLDPKNKRLRVNKKYYLRAISYIKESVASPMFYVFTDDKDYSNKIMNELGLRYKLISFNEKHGDLYEMYCMSKCTSNICANSSFSWWAAYLNTNPNKKIVFPDRFWNKSMIPKEWKVIKNTQ